MNLAPPAGVPFQTAPADVWKEGGIIHVGHLGATYKTRARDAPHAEPGLKKRGLGSRRESYIYMPEAYQSDQPLPLVLLLQCAGGHARDGLRIRLHLADKAGLILVALVLHAASYALTLGLANGDLFTHVLAFSPGFIGPIDHRGKPAIFVSYGELDAVLAIDTCGRNIARQLQAAGYDLTYQEFQGGHVIPLEVAAEAVDWVVGKQYPPGVCCTLFWAAWLSPGMISLTKYCIEAHMDMLEQPACLAPPLNWANWCV